ncbi:MAG: hypothetical protein QOJ64_4251 [Acidobacteriota bacterium]|nr:hypothetical protein [Acidobacteriota bacterium]
MAALAVAATVVVSSTTAPSSFPSRRAVCANPIFSSVIKPLQSKTRVPLRLPAIMGGDYDAALYARVGSVSRDHYLVRIGQNCERSYCPYGRVSGTKLSNSKMRPHGRAVELSGAITGYLTDGSRKLKDSTITWDQGAYRYSISVYAKEPEAMIRIANSALTCNGQ